MTKEDWKDIWQWLKKNWLGILAFFVLWLVVDISTYRLLLFVPDSALLLISRILSSSSETFVYGEDVRVYSSCLAGLVVTALFFYFYFKRIKYFLLLKEAKAAIEVLEEFDHTCDSSVLELIRKPVESAILEYPTKFIDAIKEQGYSPRQKVYSMLENVAGDYLESGSLDFFVHRGLLNHSGEELLRIYDLIIDRMREIDCISDEEAREQRSDIRDCIKQVG